jgi:hypothetical protein
MLTPIATAVAGGWSRNDIPLDVHQLSPSTPVEQHVISIEHIAPYEHGPFCKCELPARSSP